MPVVGFLGTRASGDDPQLLTALRRGLKEVGYIEGENVAVEYRFAENQYDRLPTLAADLVRRQVAVIVANGRAAQAAKEATATIPIVFVAGFDPVEVGLVASVSRPGGNITGVSILDVELGPKRLQLLHELVPAATIIAVLVNPADPARAETTSKELQAAAHTLGLQLHVLHASTDRDFDTVFARLAELRAGGLVIGGEPFFNSRSEQLGALTIRHATASAETGIASVSAATIGKTHLGAMRGSYFKPAATCSACCSWPWKIFRPVCSRLFSSALFAFGISVVSSALSTAL
jgi:putative ABC transport system substrate-binding protein